MGSKNGEKTIRIEFQQIKEEHQEKQINDMAKVVIVMRGETVHEIKITDISLGQTSISTYNPQEEPGPDLITKKDIEDLRNNTSLDSVLKVLSTTPTTGMIKSTIVDNEGKTFKI